MLKIGESPRHNVVSARLTDDEKSRFVKARKDIPQSDFVRDAVLDRIKSIEEGSPQ